MAEASDDLKDVQKILKKNKLPPDNAVEFFMTPEILEEVKEQIRIETEGHCYFYTRDESVDEKKMIHLIALINIENIADICEQVQGLKGQNEIQAPQGGSAEAEISLFD